MENWLDHEWRPTLAAAESNHTQSITQIKTTRLCVCIYIYIYKLAPHGFLEYDCFLRQKIFLNFFYFKLIFLYLIYFKLYNFNKYFFKKYNKRDIIEWYDKALLQHGELDAFYLHQLP
jgi:hypothetical protein